MSGILKNIAKKLVGAGSEQYVPYAVSKLQELAKRYGGFPISSTVQVSDGTTIMLEVHGPISGSVTIFGFSPNYEFFTTGPKLLTSPSLGFEAYRGYAVGAKYDRTKMVVTGKGLGSTVNTAVDPLALSTMFTRKNIFQIGGVPEHAYFPAWSGTGPRPFLVDSWTASSDIVGLPAIDPFQFGIADFDIAYDIPPTLFADINKPVNTQAVPDADWYKRAAVRTVVDPVFGSRTFIIMTDARNQFYVYPSVEPLDPTLAAQSAYANQGIKTNMLSGDVQQLGAPLPDWSRSVPLQEARDYMTSPYNQVNGALDTAKYVRSYPIYRWAFNSTGTRTAAIVLRDLPTAVGGNGVVAQRFDNQNGVYDLGATLPGLVELAINIVITGPEPGDFFFSLTPTLVLDPEVTQQYFMAVDYAFPIPGMCAADDLVVMQGDLYMEYKLGAAADQTHCLLTVRNYTAATVIQQFLTYDYGALGLPTQQNYKTPCNALILAYDLRMLGFVVQQSMLDNAFGAIGQDTTIRRADRLVTMAYGAVARTQILGPFADLNAQFDARFAVRDPGTWGRINPYGKDTPVGGQDSYGDTFRAPVSTDTRGLWSNALFYREIVAAVIQPSAYESFTVHPEGHWSVMTHPVFYFNGPEPVLQTPMIRADLPTLIPSIGQKATYSQDLVDMVRFNILQPDGSYQFIDTDHISLVNATYGLGLAKTDFFYSARYSEAFTVGGEDSVSFMDIYGPGANVAIGSVQYAARRASPGEPNGGFTYMFDNDALTTFEIRGFNQNYSPNTVLGSPFGTVGTQGFFKDALILRGSSLLFGTLNSVT